MDIRKVKKLIELLEESDIEEIEIKEGEESVRISRRRANTTPTFAPPAPVIITTQASPASTSGASDISSEASNKGNEHCVKSPMVGTFFRSPSIGAAPFVQVGQSVREGDIIGIIEAMKMMNQIQSDQDGVIKTILAEDSKSVEFDQTLITLE